MTFNLNECPRIRRVDALPFEIQNRPCVILRDPLRLTENTLVLPMELAFVLGLIDGTNSILDIKAEFVRRTGFSLASSRVEELIQVLDDNLMLDGVRYQQALCEIEQQFRANPIRRAFHAGQSYPLDPSAVIDLVDHFYKADGGPGAIALPGKGKPAKAIVAPHIDLNAGGPTFSWAYHALAQGAPPTRFIILGTGHQGAQNLFAITKKDFETPLGLVKTDKAFVNRLTEGSSVDYFADEMLHRTEHVIEFQLLFLQHLYGAEMPYTIVPIVCSFDPEYFFLPECKPQHSLFQDFLGRLVTAVKESEGDTCLIASVDLDHMGPRYGDSFNPTQAVINESLEADRCLLNHLERADGDRFLETARRLNPRHKICGFPALYTMIKTGLTGPGRILKLDSASVDNHNSYVTFAAMVFP